MPRKRQIREPNAKAIQGGSKPSSTFPKAIRKKANLEIYTPDPLEIDGQLISHNVWVDGHRTSLRLEAIMWTAMNAIAEREDISLHDLVTLISRHQHAHASLTATVRAFLLAYFFTLAPKDAPRLLQKYFQNRQEPGGMTKQ